MPAGLGRIPVRFCRFAFAGPLRRLKRRFELYENLNDRDFGDRIDPPMTKFDDCAKAAPPPALSILRVGQHSDRQAHRDVLQ
jgi:hypothetical protein